MLQALNARTVSKSGLKSLNSTDPWMILPKIFQSLILKVAPRFEVCGAIACSATPNTVAAMQRQFAAESSKINQTCLEELACEQRTVTSSAQLEDTVHQLPAHPGSVIRPVNEPFLAQRPKTAHLQASLTFKLTAAKRKPARAIQHPISSW